MIKLLTIIISLEFISAHKYSSLFVKRGFLGNMVKTLQSLKITHRLQQVKLPAQPGIRHQNIHSVLNSHYDLSKIADTEIVTLVRKLLKSDRKLSHEEFKTLISRVIKVGDSQLTIRALSLQQHRSVKQYLDVAKLVRETPAIDGAKISRAITEKIANTIEPAKYVDLYHGYQRIQSTLEKAENLASKYVKDATNPNDKKIWMDILDDLREIKNRGGWFNKLSS